MATVYQAEPYSAGRMGSLGDASCMLLRQEDFPHQYDEDREMHLQADHDRCMQWDYEHASRCFQEHIGTGEMGLQDWLRSASKEQVIAFLVDILKAEEHKPGTTWTGFRILGSVHRGNGYPVWGLELFAKHPDTNTQVFTGGDAPNVMKRESRYG